MIDLWIKPGPREDQLELKGNVDATTAKALRHIDGAHCEPGAISWIIPRQHRSLLKWILQQTAPDRWTDRADLPPKTQANNITRAIVDTFPKEPAP